MVLLLPIRGLILNEPSSISGTGNMCPSGPFWRLAKVLAVPILNTPGRGDQPKPGFAEEGYNCLNFKSTSNPSPLNSVFVFRKLADGVMSELRRTSRSGSSILSSFSSFDSFTVVEQTSCNLYTQPRSQPLCSSHSSTCENLIESKNPL